MNALGKPMAVALLLACSSHALACLNRADSGISVPEGFNLEEGTRKHILRHSPPPAGGWEKWSQDLAAAPDLRTNPNKRNDYGVALVRLGRTAEAIALFEELEKEKPGQYLTAVNLGTTYELAGNVDLALHWIREGVKRNPASHQGTEWLHVRILQAKLALRQDPAWLQSHSILDGGAPLTGSAPAPMRARTITDDTGRMRDAQEIEKAIVYQLRERTGLVRPKDPIIAELLLELAGLTAFSAGAEDSLELIELAGEYGPARTTLHASREEHFKAVIRSNSSPRK